MTRRGTLSSSAPPRTMEEWEALIDRGFIELRRFYKEAGMLTQSAALLRCLDDFRAICQAVTKERCAH